MTYASFFVLCASISIDLVPRAGLAQERRLRIPGGASEAQIVARAEAEGAMFPRRPAPEARASFSPSVAQSVESDAKPIARAGSDDRRCVAVARAPTRSGEFVVSGDFVAHDGTEMGGLPSAWRSEGGVSAKRPLRIWWSPAHNAADMPPLLIRARALAKDGDTLRILDSAIVHPPNPGPPPRTPKGPFEFLSGIEFPTSGRWILIATSGANWGCFVFDVR